MREPKMHWRFETARWMALALAVTLSTGCATAPRGQSANPLDLQLQARGLDPAAVTVPYALDDTMRAWAHTVAPPELGELDRLEALVEALLDNGELELEYSWGYTGTAQEVFLEHRANCLAFTNLFVGLAREVGVPVFFLAVETETFRKHEDFVVVSDHIAVAYRTGLAAGKDVRMYDFSENPGQELAKVRPISDLTAIAMFHSNRGAEALQRGDLVSALDWLRLAVAIDPDMANGWLNLGVARRRAGDLEGAEMAYKRSLEIDPRTYPAYQNLATMLHAQGRTDEAQDFQEALQRSPNRNPYSYLSLGDISFRSGRWTEARRFYRRAARLETDGAEPYAALGHLAAVEGDFETARRMLRKAMRLDRNEPRTQRLANLVASPSG